jgi:ABC-type cobalamin/Fe3+-siderophores transport system ATPase subunit
VHRYARRVFMMKNGRIHLAGQVEQSRTSKSELFATIQEGGTYEALDA